MNVTGLASQVATLDHVMNHWPGSVWIVIAAGGVGRRAGGDSGPNLPKQYRMLRGRTVLAASVAAMRAARAHVVVAADNPEVARKALSGLENADSIRVVRGGDDRRASVAAGLVYVPDTADVIGTHDAARPLASPAMVAAGVRVLGAGADAAVPVVPVTDSIREVGDDCMSVAVDRSRMVAVQTPQLFRADVLRDAHLRHEGPATDDASMVEACGGRVVTFAGDVNNLKITHPQDFVLAEAILDV